MRINLLVGYTPSYILEVLNLALTANGLAPLSRQDQIRGYRYIPAQDANNVVRSLKTFGLA